MDGKDESQGVFQFLSTFDVFVFFDFHFIFLFAYGPHGPHGEVLGPAGQTVGPCSKFFDRAAPKMISSAAWRGSFWAQCPPQKHECTCRDDGIAEGSDALGPVLHDLRLSRCPDFPRAQFRDGVQYSPLNDHVMLRLTFGPSVSPWKAHQQFRPFG